MNERQLDIAIVGTYLSLLSLMAVQLEDVGFRLVVAITVVAGIAMRLSRQPGPFAPRIRRRFRTLILVAAVAAGCTMNTRRDDCCAWPLFVVVTAVTYVSLRVHMFQSPDGVPFARQRRSMAGGAFDVANYTVVSHSVDKAADEVVAVLKPCDDTSTSRWQLTWSDKATLRLPDGDVWGPGNRIVDSGNDGVRYWMTMESEDVVEVFAGELVMTSLD